MEIGGASVTNFGGNAMGDVTLAQATIYSSNTVFGQLGAEMGSDMLVSGADAFGFDSDIDFELPVSTSIMSNPAYMNDWETAWAAAGQPVGDENEAGPIATVLQMALVGCGIANDGTIMAPYLVSGVYNANGEQSYEAQPTVLHQAVSADVAQRVRSVLTDAVSYGTGTGASIYGVDVAGKTGTAETDKEHDDSWFVGMAPAENPDIVVAIVLEEAVDSEWSDNAALKSRNVLVTALQKYGVL